jgi:hypothetical protein
MPIYIFKTALAFHIFEDQQGSNIQAQGWPVRHMGAAAVRYPL